MRILTITHFYSTRGGGIEIVADRLCREFCASGHDAVWAASDSDPLDAPGVELLTLHCIDPLERLTGLPMPIPGLGSIWKLWRKTQRVDAVVIHDGLYVTSIIAMLAARLARKPTVLIQHSAIPFKQGVLRAIVQVANRLVTWPMLKAAGRVAFISGTTKNTFAKATLKEPPLMVFNGVDPTVFYPRNASLREDLRRSFELPTDKKLCLFVGRFVERKGLAALFELARLRPDLHFAFAGRGPLAPEKWGFSNVTVLHGLTHLTLAPLYSAADMLLLPSAAEGYPLVIQEALACGLRVICSDEIRFADPGVSDWLTGVPVSLNEIKGTAALLSEAIDRLDINSTDKERMSDYARQTYRWETMAAAILSDLRRQRDRAVLGSA